jgi:hypothetical protein
MTDYFRYILGKNTQLQDYVNALPVGNLRIGEAYIVDTLCHANTQQQGGMKKIVCRNVVTVILSMRANNFG